MALMLHLSNFWQAHVFAGLYPVLLEKYKSSLQGACGGLHVCTSTSFRSHPDRHGHTQTETRCVEICPV